MQRRHRHQEGRLAPPAPQPPDPDRRPPLRHLPAQPRRFWEGGGEAHVKAHLQHDPPPITADAKAQTAALKAAGKAIEAARSAADAADQVEATALAGSKPATTARTSAQTAQTSAILAVETALKLGAKLPLQIRRYLQEVDA